MPGLAGARGPARCDSPILNWLSDWLSNSLFARHIVKQYFQAWLISFFVFLSLFLVVKVLSLRAGHCNNVQSLQQSLDSYGPFQPTLYFPGFFV